MDCTDLTVPGRLRGVSGRCAPGTITAICGPNGAGKSTVLSALAGLLVPARGEVRLDGALLAGLHPNDRARRIGYLPQGGDLAWDMAVHTVVALGRLPHGDSAGLPVTQALATLGLDHLAHRPFSTLSGGERARVLLARVLAGQPQWVLADEPLAALDLAHQLALLRHLRAAAAAGTGVVLVLHDLALAMNHADQVLLLDRGELVSAGPPSQVLSEMAIGEVWGVSARWLGDDGSRALVIG